MDLKRIHDNNENHYCNLDLIRNTNFYSIHSTKNERFADDEMLSENNSESSVCKICRNCMTGNNFKSTKTNKIDFQVKKKPRLNVHDYGYLKSSDRHYININATIPFCSNNIDVKEPIYENIEVFKQARLNAVNSVKLKNKNSSNNLNFISGYGVSNQYLRSYNPYMPMCTPIIIQSSNITNNRANEFAKKIKTMQKKEEIKKLGKSLK